MELPEIVRRVGIIDRKKIVYIEEYVLQYLQIYRSEEKEKQERIGLYGKHECRENVDIYMIYFVYPETEEQQTIGEKYEKIGYLRHKCHLEQGEMTLTGEKSMGTISGYYIFYDTNERMKDYLSKYYESKLRQENLTFSRSEFYKMNEEKSEVSELIALSQRKIGQSMSIYSLIRMATIGILIIFCAIAVTTINASDKMSDFVQTIAQTNEWVENEHRQEEP